MTTSTSGFFQMGLRQEFFWLKAGLLVIFMFTVVDMAGDIKEGANLLHLVEEGVIALVSAAAFFQLIGRNRVLAASLRVQEKNLEISRQEALRWKAEASGFLAGLGYQIDIQLERWALTAAEKEVALLLLKGLSLKEVAEVRSVGEKTVRSQSLAIYAKSGLKGRAELSAFFLEDLLLPNNPEATARGVSPTRGNEQSRPALN